MMDEDKQTEFPKGNKDAPLTGQNDVSEAASGLSPLDQIQAAEREVARQVAAAREAAELLIAKTKAQLADLKHEAQEAGCREGQTEYNKIVAKAEEAAKTHLEQARKKAEDFSHRNAHRMDALARHVVTIIIGMQD